MAEKNYVASSIKKVTTQYGDLFNASLKTHTSHLKKLLLIKHKKQTTYHFNNIEGGEDTTSKK